MLPQFAIPEFDKATLDNNDPLLPCPVAVKITRTGVIGAVIARSKADSNRYLVTWFNRHFWRVERQWLDRECFELLPVDVYPTTGAA